MNTIEQNKVSVTIRHKVSASRNEKSGWDKFWTLHDLAISLSEMYMHGKADRDEFMENCGFIITQDPSQPYC